MDFTKKQREYQAARKYQVMFNRYFHMLYNLTISRFEWVGLPDYILPSYIEKVLCDNGQAVFFYDDVAEKYAVMKSNQAGTPDIYGFTDMRFAYSNQYYRTLNKKNSVLMRDNMDDFPMIDYIMMYADSLTNMRLTRDINIYAQRTPIVFAGDKSMEMSTRNLFKNYDDFVKFLYVKDSVMNLDKLKALNVAAPYVADKMQSLMNEEISAFLTLVGIDNSDISKKERAITSESSSNDGLIEMNRNSQECVRVRTCRQINKLFGLNASVRFRSKIKLSAELRGDSALGNDSGKMGDNINHDDKGGE